MKWLRKIKCWFGKHQTRTIVLHRDDGTEFLSGTFCDYCDYYHLNEVNEDEQIIPAEETDSN